ncbi:MAG: transposase [Alphaproteobacteria bacterium]|nr:transposase [Alphaproteobacteria bacterium]
MKKNKFTDSQIAFILRQAEEGTAIAEVCRKARISVQTYSRWRKKYGGLMPSKMKRVKQLEEENMDRFHGGWVTFSTVKTDLERIQYAHTTTCLLPISGNYGQ